MSTVWSYSGDPATSGKDSVRFLIGDVDPKAQALTDAEVNYAIAVEGSVMMAAITCAEACMARFVRLVSESDTDADKKSRKREYQQRVDSYKTLIQQLKAKRARRAIGIFAGGISQQDKLSQEQDDDRVAPDFRKEMMENPSIQTPLDDLRSDF